MKRIVVLYGISGGLLVAALKVAEYRFLVIEHSVQLYAGLIALVFAAIGVRLGLTLTREKAPAVDRPIVATRNEPFVPNTQHVAELGITPRELEILQQIARGLSTREIGEVLFVSENTVKTHASRLFEKLNVRRRTQAVHEGRRLGLIP